MPDRCARSVKNQPCANMPCSHTVLLQAPSWSAPQQQGHMRNAPLTQALGTMAAPPAPGTERQPRKLMHRINSPDLANANHANSRHRREGQRQHTLVALQASKSGIGDKGRATIPVSPCRPPRRLNSRYNSPGKTQSNEAERRLHSSPRRMSSSHRLLAYRPRRHRLSSWPFNEA